MFANSLVPYGTGALDHVGNSLFGQAVNKKMALHFLGDEERVKDALNPADPLMIPLYECCFISPIRAGMGGTFSSCCVRAFSMWC